MGLDQYLNGRKFYGGVWQLGEPLLEDGFPLDTIEVSLGYWRKHPNLHGYIVETFAKGQDDCQDIVLGVEDLVQIIEAVQTDQLKHTSGFFFGELPVLGSGEYEEQKLEDLVILGKALGWLSFEFNPKPHSKYVIYRASW